MVLFENQCKDNHLLIDNCELFKKNTSGLIGGVSINTLKSLYFMLPPLSEQLRIVCAVEKVFSYMDEIEKSLN